MILDFKSQNYLNPEKIRPILAKATKLILYHGTSSIFQELILNKGLICRNLSGNSTYEGVKNTSESNPNQVYLGSFENARVKGFQAVDKFGGEIQIYRTIIPFPNLLPDEDSKKPNALESLIIDSSCAINNQVPLNDILGFYVKHIESKIDRLKGIFPLFFDIPSYDYHRLKHEPQIDEIFYFLDNN